MSGCFFFAEWRLPFKVTSWIHLFKQVTTGGYGYLPCLLRHSIYLNTYISHGIQVFIYLFVDDEYMDRNFLEYEWIITQEIINVVYVWGIGRIVRRKTFIIFFFFTLSFTTLLGFLKIYFLIKIKPKIQKKIILKMRKYVSHHMTNIKKKKKTQHDHFLSPPVTSIFVTLLPGREADMSNIDESVSPWQKYEKRVKKTWIVSRRASVMGYSLS